MTKKTGTRAFRVSALIVVAGVVALAVIIALLIIHAHPN